MYLEDSDGKTIDDPTDAQLVAVLNRIGNGLEHCILNCVDPSGQEWFIQTAGSRAGLLLQYSDASGLFESARSDFDVATVSRVFLDAAKGGKAWKTEFSFRLTEGADQPVGSPHAPGPDRQTAHGEKPFKDQLLDAVANGSISSAGNLIRNGVKSFFRKMF